MRCARVSLTITTGSSLLFWSSSALKSRPAMTGTPSAAKNPGEMTRRKIADQRSEAGIAPGNDVAERGLTHARKRVDAPHRFLVEIDDLPRRLTVRHSGNVDRQDVLRIQSCLSP